MLKFYFLIWRCLQIKIQVNDFSTHYSFTGADGISYLEHFFLLDLNFFLYNRTPAFSFLPLKFSLYPSHFGPCLKLLWGQAGVEIN